MIAHSIRFLLHLAADLICAVNGTAEIVGIGTAAAAAVESGKAILAAFLCIYVAKLKLIAYFLIYNARIYVAQKELLISYKLMAGVEITPWSNCQILCT